PGRLSNSPRSVASRICLSIHVSKLRPAGLRSVIAPPTSPGNHSPTIVTKWTTSIGYDRPVTVQDSPDDTGVTRQPGITRQRRQMRAALRDTPARRVARPAPLREAVYDSLIELIITRALQPGQHLVESELADQLGVSRQPVRE